MLSQAHPYLSGFLFGLRLLRLLSCCDWGPGARTCHHVLAQREMGLHRCALRFLALRPQEVCYQGDLSLLVTLLTKMYPNSMATRYATTSGDVHSCCLVTGWCRCCTCWPTARIFFLSVFCPWPGFHYLAVFMQLHQRTKGVTN